MTLRERHPGDLTEAERFAEISRILAAGYLRHRTSRSSARDQLDVSRRVEAPCGSEPQNPKSAENAA